MRDYVTVVSGLPRSGTSMMMRMLGAGGLPLLTDDRRTADADNPLGYYEYEPVKRLERDQAWFRQAVGMGVKIIHMLLPSLPASVPCRIVFMDRDLEEVVASQARMLERLGREGAAADPETLTGVFERQLQRTRGWLAAQHHLSVLEVSYADTIADPAATVETVCRFLGPDPMDAEAMREAIEPRLYRQRRSIT